MPTERGVSTFKDISNDVEEILHYEMSGFFSPSRDLDLYFDYLDLLIRIEFILRKEVLHFIVELPNRIRSIKTIVLKNPELVKGRIDGKINWHSTIKTRMSQNPLDKTSFVIERVERYFNIPENLVLKETLSILFSIIYDDLPIAIEHSEKYPNLRQLVRKKGLREIIREIFLKNIYIRRITLDERQKINDRMISDTLKARSALYREAAQLLGAYRKLIN